MKLFLSILGVAVVCLVGLLRIGELRWRASTREVVARLQSDGSASSHTRFEVADLDRLPDPVARYFRAVLHPGQPLIRHGRLHQQGQFLVKPVPDGWRAFEATHYFRTRPAGFVWNARIRMAPAVDVHVRDGFVQGKGLMRASLMGVVPLVSVEGTPEIAAGALHRYLAEAVWFPTALLPGEGVVWAPLDDSSARATLTVDGTMVWLDFRFGPDGLVESVFTPARARDVGGRSVPTPWQGRFFAYEERADMRVPLAGEVEWVLPGGPQVYWRGRITEAAYEFSDGLSVRAPGPPA